MLGPVISSRRRLSASRQSLAMKVSALLAISPSTTGWRPPVTVNPISGANSGLLQLRFNAVSAKPASRSSWAMARAMVCSVGTAGSNSSRMLLVEQLFAGQRAFLGGQRLVLEGLQFRRDVALGVLQRLAAAVIVGNLVDMGVRDLDVEAMHLVELDLEAGDAGALALADFHVDQEGAAVVVERAQFVEFGIVTRRDDAAVAHLGAPARRRWRGPAVRGTACGVARSANKLADQRRRTAGQRSAQAVAAGPAIRAGGKVARPGIAQGDARRRCARCRRCRAGHVRTSPASRP